MGLDAWEVTRFLLQIVSGYDRYWNDNSTGRRAPSSGLLEDVTSCVIVLTHSCFEKLTYLPFPVGVIVEAVEDAVDPYTHPLIHGVEGFTLRLLSTVDDQVNSSLLIVTIWFTGTVTITDM